MSGETSTVLTTLLIVSFSGIFAPHCWLKRNAFYWKDLTANEICLQANWGNAIFRTKAIRISLTIDEDSMLQVSRPAQHFRGQTGEPCRFSG